MTPLELEQLYIDSIYYSVNSNPPKPRAEVFYEMVRDKLAEEHTAQTHPGD